MRRFVSEKRNIEVDDEKRTVYMSEVFKLYGDGFARHVAKEGASVLDYILSFAEGEQRAAVERALPGRYRLAFREYDWRLNERGAERTLAP